MEAYWCLDGAGKIIGVVDAISGDAAWALTQIVQPQAVRIYPVWLPLH